jgi:hypothetical protein
MHQPGSLPLTATAARLKELAYEERRAALSNAWRNPVAQEAEAKPAPSATATAADAAAAADARDQRLRDAWKGAA